MRQLTHVGSARSIARTFGRHISTDGRYKCWFNSERKWLGCPLAPKLAAHGPLGARFAGRLVDKKGKIPLLRE